MGTGLTGSMAVSLGLTVLFEEAWGFLRGIRNKWDMALILLANILTNPAVVFLYHMACGSRHVAAAVLLLELSAIGAEAVCYQRAGAAIRHPWRFSLEANMISYFLGAALSKLV